MGASFGSLMFQSPFQASIGLSGTFTTADGTFSDQITIVDYDPYQPQACTIVNTDDPVPQGTSNLSASSPCTLNWISVGTNSPQQFTFKYGGSIFVTRADGTGASFGFSVTTTYALSTGPVASALDLAVDTVEVVQVIQDEHNSMPLIANKSTAVRVFATVSGNNAQPLAGVSGTLRGFRNGVELPGSPLAPANHAITVPVEWNPANAGDSLNFLLPKNWTAAGSIRLVAGVSPPAGVTEQNTANNTFPQPVTFTALANIPYPLNIYYWPICYQPPGEEKKCPTANVSGADTLIPKLYPIPDDGVRYVPLQIPQKTWTKPLITSDDVDQMFTTLRKAYLILEAHYGNVDQLAAWLPNIPGAEQGGMADASWAGEGGTSRVTFNEDTSGTTENIGWILAHETGHNMGLRHTNTADGCKAEDPDGDWKLPDATIQEIGMDPLTMEVKPSTKMDLMSYCYDPLSNIWISDFHYGQLISSQALQRAASAPVAPSVSDTAQPAAAQPQNIASEYLLIGGSARADGTAGSLDPAYQLTAVTPGESSDPAGNHCLRFITSGGASSDFCFTLAFRSRETFAPLDAESFSFRVALPAGTTRIALRHRAQELASLTVSSQAPSLKILKPSAGDKWNGSNTITWSGSDPKGNPLSYVVQYSADGGNSWVPMEVDLQQPSFTFDTAEIQAGTKTYFRVLATSGVTTASAIVGPIEITATPRIEAPPSLAFGIVTPGQIANQTIWVRNKGNGPLTVHSLGIDNPVFTLVSPAAPLTLPAQGRQQVTVRFTPTATGGQTGTLTISSNDPANATTTVSVTGGQNQVSPVPSISVTPTSLAFGNVGAGQTKDVSLTVQNTGAASLAVSSLSIVTGPFRVVSPSTPFDLPAGGQRTVTIRFSPKTAGSKNGTLTIASNDPTQPSVSVSLTGQGVAASAPPVAVLFSDTFNRADSGSCSLGPADLSLGGSGTYYYLPIFTADAGIVSGALQNNGQGYSGVQVTDSPNACSSGQRGVNVGHDLNIKAELYVPPDVTSHISQAGPYFHGRAAAARDGIIGGDSSGYWTQLDSTGTVKVKNLSSSVVVASTAPQVRFDNTIFHTVEMAAQGSQLQVALDGQLLTFIQNGASSTSVSIPATGGSDDGAAGIAFGDDNNPGRVGGQRARNLVVAAFHSLAAAFLPQISPSGVTNAASFQAGIASGSWITIYGDHLSATTRLWTAADFVGNRLPVILDGVSVKVNGKDAPVYFISPTQINALAPSDSALGSVRVTVTNAQGTSAAAAATLQTYLPGFFLFDPENRRYLAAVHANGAFLGKSGLFGSAATTQPAKPGEIISLFGTGFGPTSPAVLTDEIFAGAAPLAIPGQLTIQIGGVAATIKFAGLVGQGLYQFNVLVPDVPNGDQAVVANIAGTSSQPNVFLTVQR